jgi:hypothetical protein
MTEPRNVTPDDARPDEFHRRYYSERAQGPEWSGWNMAQRGWNVPWLGILLVLVGVGLLIQYFVPGVSAGTLVLTAIAFAFLAAWLLGRSRWAVVPGLLILALAAAGLARELNVYDGPGLTAIALTVAFALIWLLDYARGVRSTWPLWGVAIFGLIGIVQVSGRIVAIPELGAVWPVVIIVIGGLLLLSARRGPEPPRRP